MNATYATVDKQTPATVSNFLSDFQSAPNSEANNRAQKFLKEMDEDARDRFLKMANIIGNVADAVEILTLAVTYRNKQIIGPKGEKISGFSPIGGEITFAAVAVISETIARYNEGLPEGYCERNSVFDGWDRMRGTGLINDLDIPEHKSVIEDFIHGDEMEIIIK